jgi:eukaryotic-like serine/threonine-protein kinase
MTLSAGTRLGPYELGEPIGAGGMGEVYRAKDTRLERTGGRQGVARAPVGVGRVPSAVRARGEDDLAALPHAHLRSVRRRQPGRGRVPRHGIPGGLLETLSERLLKGPLPFEQVLRYGTEIADAEVTEPTYDPVIDNDRVR